MVRIFLVALTLRVSILPKFRFACRLAA